MALDPKASLSSGPPVSRREKGVRIFTYPKIIFIFPTLIMSLICWIGMWVLGDPDASQTKAAKPDGSKVVTTTPVDKSQVVVKNDDTILPSDPNPIRFRQKENLLGMIFLGVLFFNLLILAVDFPRFTIFAMILLATTILFFCLWLGMYFQIQIMGRLEYLFSNVYVRANTQFYFWFSLILLSIYGLVFATRWLDYWEILPNEILHHHGPLSDLERYPTLNLKFDKEIPDVFEHLMFGAGRLVLHVSEEHKAIIMDTVLHVSRKEEALKKLMSRLEVRVTTDQEVAAP